MAAESADDAPETLEDPTLPPDEISPSCHCFCFFFCLFSPGYGSVAVEVNAFLAVFFKINLLHSPARPEMGVLFDFN